VARSLRCGLASCAPISLRAPCTEMLRLSPAANIRHCQVPSAVGKPGRMCEKPAPGMRSANGATGVRHAPAADGATVRYRSLQWSQSQRLSQLTIQMKSSAAPQHLHPPVQPPLLVSQRLGLFRHWQRPAMGAQHGLHGAARLVRVDTMCLHFSYPDSIRTTGRAAPNRRFLRCMPTSSQVCFEPQTTVELTKYPPQVSGRI
jgi:hypothetical protein